MKPDVLAFIKKIKKFFVFASIVLLALAMTFIVNAVAVSALWLIAAGACIVCFIVALVLYLSRVKYSIVYDLSFAGGVINIKVKGGAYTFSPENLEKALYDKTKIILCFIKNGERERFLLLRRVPFERFRQNQFTLDDVAAFFPQIEAD